MRVAASWLGVCLLYGAAVAQNPPDAGAIIAARQADVARLARLSSIDLARGGWQHEEFAVCPAFTHHVFAYYRRGPQPGVRSGFVAIYPAQGGPVRLVPVAGSLPNGAEDLKKAAAARESSIQTFNAVWSEELEASGHPMTFPGLTWAELGECYARMTGEVPVIEQDPASAMPLPTIDRVHPAKGMLIHVAQTGDRADGAVRTVLIDLDPTGMLQSASIAEQPAFQVIHPAGSGEFKVVKQDR
jgi:hypothetical protein